MALARFLEGTAFGVLNDILSSFHSQNGGYAVPNRFEVLINPPARMRRANEARQVSMRCETVNLPGRNLATMEDTNIYGPTREIVNGVTYADELNMTFQASSGLEERVFFEEWQAEAFGNWDGDKGGNWNVKYYNDYTGNVEISILDRQDNKRYGIKLWEAFPKTITGTDLGQGLNNELIKLGVTFSFRYWTSLDETRKMPNLTEKIFDTITTGVERQLQSNLPRVLTKLF
jgi:hypothetical protein